MPFGPIACSGASPEKIIPEPRMTRIPPSTPPGVTAGLGCTGRPGACKGTAPGGGGSMNDPGPNAFGLKGPGAFSGPTPGAPGAPRGVAGTPGALSGRPATAATACGTYPLPLPVVLTSIGRVA